jgi:hypothetical protein
MDTPRYISNSYDPKISAIISSILEIETILTLAVFNGHKASIGDEYRDERIELTALRKELGIIHID